MSLARSPQARENSRRLSREAKRRRTGSCSVCGVTTRYNGHDKAVSDMCRPCAARSVQAAKRGVGGHVVRAAITFLEDGPKNRAEIREHLRITDGHVSNVLHRLVKYGLVRRVTRGLYEVQR